MRKPTLREKLKAERRKVRYLNCELRSCRFAFDEMRLSKAESDREVRSLERRLEAAEKALGMHEPIDLDSLDDSGRPLAEAT